MPYKDKLKNNECVKNWRKKNLSYYSNLRKQFPEKFKARDALNGAVRRGKIKRGPCVKCGEIKTEGHHTDYSKPLDVLWFCRQCHENEHHAKS